MASPMYSCERLSNSRGPESVWGVHLFSYEQAEHAKLRDLGEPHPFKLEKRLKRTHDDGETSET